VEQRALEIFHEREFTTEGAPAEAAEDRSEQALITLPPQEVEQAIQACAPEPEWVAEMTDNPIPHEDPDRSTQVALDDVNVKRQEATRKDAPEPVQERKYVHNTIANIALAALTALVRNQEYKQWFQTGALSFSILPCESTAQVGKVRISVVGHSDPHS
jgi:hypothetical protein